MTAVCLAHIAEDGREQSVAEHLKATAMLCWAFANDFGKGAHGELIGLLHDIGKYSDAFQRRLCGGIKVDHSTAGAVEACKKGHAAAAFCIAGHHTGLPDGGFRGEIEGTSLQARLNRATKGGLEDYSAWKVEILNDVPSVDKIGGIDPVEQSFLIRMLFSCLVDADYLDTEQFMKGKTRTCPYDDIPALAARITTYTAGFFPARNQLNERRCDILQTCLAQAKNASKGIFTLTVPTGGGKTIASLAFALNHAAVNKMQRVIYVIPYTSIIEQTADVFRSVLHDRNVLEHHSNLSFPAEEAMSAEQIRKLQATENWDAPVVVTTAVQFFESLYANKPAACRKLHNIANSVIIFDEAQMLPFAYLDPCVYAIAQLVKNYGCSAVLCTATQPSLQGLFAQYIPQTDFIELCPGDLFADDVFNRVVFQKLGKQSWKTLAGSISSHKQALCIVNSRRNAVELYRTISATEQGVYHLSTFMYPMHRKAVLREIRERLRKNLPCIVIATSLIEAGVDVDFPIVYREEAGLDSVLQAAGRCNREGTRPREQSVVSVFRAENAVPPVFEIPIAAGRFAMEQYEDLSSKAAVDAYFHELFDLRGAAERDKKHILQQLRENNFPFQTVAEQFRLIENDTKTVYIRTESSGSAIESLLHGGCSRALYRELALYAVEIYEDHFRKLCNAGALQPIDEYSAVLADDTLYSYQTGLAFEVESGQALFI